MAFKKRTRNDLAALDSNKARIDEINRESKRIIDDCSHLDFEPRLVETLQFEHMAQRVCPVCEKKLGSATEDEARRLFVELLVEDPDDANEWELREVESAVAAGGYTFKRLTID